MYDDDTPTWADNARGFANDLIKVRSGIGEPGDDGDVEQAVGGRKGRWRRGLDVDQGTCIRRGRFDSRLRVGRRHDDERPSVEPGDEPDLRGKGRVPCADDDDGASGLGTDHRQRGLMW